MKICIKCNITKELLRFYKHPKMSDGHFNKCKECYRIDVRANRAQKINDYRSYDRVRNSHPARVEAMRLYSKTDAGKAARRRSSAKYRDKYPNARKAQQQFGNALRSGRVEKQYICSVCDSDRIVEGHHDDYCEPLNVRWLCSTCHNKWHKHNTPKNRK